MQKPNGNERDNWMSRRDFSRSSRTNKTTLSMFKRFQPTAHQKKTIQSPKRIQVKGFRQILRMEKREVKGNPQRKKRKRRRERW